MAKNINQFITEEADHHFCVNIPSSKTSDVVITENYVRQDPDLPPVISDVVKPRVIIPKKRWDLIAPSLRHEFNDRMRRIKKKSANWRSGLNKVSRAFGKELVVLAWAIEQTEDENVSAAIQNWLGLSPEERWWLYTQANATCGHAEKGKGKGWRKAIGIALTENPVQTQHVGPEAGATASPFRTTEELRKSLTIS